MHHHRNPRDTLLQPALALGGAMLWGVIEFVALCRSRWSERASSTSRAGDA